MQQLKNRDIHLQIYVGAISKNKANDKGIDDLLSHTLKDKEDLLHKELNFILNEKEAIGEYLQLHKITIWNDFKLSELWHLNNPSKFAEFHKEILKELPEFKIGRHNWRFDEEGKIESTRPIETYEQFWNEIDKKTKTDGTRILFTNLTTSKVCGFSKTEVLVDTYSPTANLYLYTSIRPL